MKKGQKKELLNTEDILTIESLFQFEKLELKKGSHWTLKLALKTQLPEAYREYKLRFSLNEKPYEAELEQLEKRKYEIETEPQLFEGNKKQAVRDVEGQMKDVEKDLENAREVYEDIECHCAIEQLAYKDSDTVVVFVIPAETVDALNKHRNDFVNYKVELIRE